MYIKKMKIKYSFEKLCHFQKSFTIDLSVSMVCASTSQGMLSGAAVGQAFIPKECSPSSPPPPAKK